LHKKKIEIQQTASATESDTDTLRAEVKAAIDKQRISKKNKQTHTSHAVEISDNIIGNLITKK